MASMGPGMDFEILNGQPAALQPRAADAIWGAEAMRASRRDLTLMHGNTPLLWFQADRLEVQPGTGADRYLWDMQGYYGGPTSRIWLKTEGGGRLGKRIDEAEVQVHHARAIAPFFDVQAGVRQDLAAQDVPLLGIGAVLDSVEIGVRLRYEIRREFAPYIGVEQQWRTGRGADFARAAGQAPRATQVLAGVRLWF